MRRRTPQSKLRRLAARPADEVAVIHFGFDSEERRFTLRPFGDNAVDMCRTLTWAEQVPKQNLFTLPEMFWYELHEFCQSLGMYPEVLRNFVQRLKPDITESIPSVTPTGVELRPYQVDGGSLMIRPGGTRLADQMGLGKTGQALAAYAYLKAKGLAKVMIVVGPPSVLKQWGEEAHKFVGEGAYVIEEPVDIVAAPEEGIICINYAKLYRDPYQSYLLKLIRTRDTIVCMDEFHKAGHEGSVQNQALSHMCRGAKWRWGLTGTEVKNQPDSVLPGYRLLTGATIKGEEFRSYYCRSNGTWDEEKLERVQTVLRQHGVRRLQADVLQDLPPLTEMLHVIPLGEEEKKLLATLKAGGVLEVLDEDGLTVKLIQSKGVLGHHIREFQITSHPMLVGGKAELKDLHKWQRLREILMERGDQQVIVWSYHPDTLDWLHKQLKTLGLDSRVVHGGVNQTTRDEIRQQFWAGSFPVLLANPLSYAEGVNLQCASVNIYWDEHWSKDAWEQSTRRSYRLGQERPVTIHYLRTEGTIEMTCFNWVRRKKELADAMVGEATNV